MATVSLQMIIKNETAAVIDLIRHNSAALEVFDAINLTVSDKKAANVLKRELNYPKVKIVHRPWNDNFADARNDNLTMCDTDYFFWVDADDAFDFNEIPKLVDYAEANDFEAIYLPYNYGRDEDGHVVAVHDRERLIRTDAGFTWRGAIHESLLKEGSFRAKRLQTPVVDHLSKDIEGSKMRNHKILKTQVVGVDNPDPRYVYYYGISCFGVGEYREAIKWLNEYMKVGGWDEELYRALIKISESYFMIDDYANACDAALKAAGMLPHYPDAYLNLARYEYAYEHWQECIEWVEVGLAKPPVQTMSVKNPQQFEIAKLYYAVSLYNLDKHKAAYLAMQNVAPHLRGDLLDGFKQQANLETFIKLIPELIPYLSAQAIWDNIPDSLKYDNRLKWLRNKMIMPKKWDDNSIVIFCGAGYEEWGAHTLDKGMGGSEESIVYLSRELAKLGYEVTIYNETPETYVDPVEYLDGRVKTNNGRFVEGKGVIYKPWREFDNRDQFNIISIWRAPSYAEKVKAKKILIDMHDVLDPDAVIDVPPAIYMVKSQYHRNLYPHLPDEKFAIIGNGIIKQQFEYPKPDQNHKVGYFSAYYRGCETLVKLWPQVRQQVPDAELHIAYGWGSWVAFQGEDDFYHRMNALFDKYKDQGVIVHDRLSHEDLAKLMIDTQVWAYPTEFPEIHCITALKAQEALCYPVTTTVAALDETVQSGVKLDTKTIYSDGYQQGKFVKEIVAALKEGKRGTPVPGVDWVDVAKAWDNVIKGMK